jgi:hypothetical protein
MNGLLATLLIGAAAFGVKFGADRSFELNRGRIKLVTPPPLSSLDRKIIDIVTLGQRALYDDFMNVWMIQILGDPAVKSENADAIAKTVYQVTRLKPKVESMYMLPCFILGLDFNRPELCERMIIDGLAAFPESWRLPMTQGFMFAFKLNDPAKAAGFYSLAASRPQSPPYVGSLAKKLLNKESVSQEDVNTALELMFKVPGGSRFESFMMQNRQNSPAK